MTEEERKEYNREKMRRWRASLTEEEREALRIVSASQKAARFAKDESLKERHRAASKAYYHRKKGTVDESGKPWKPKIERDRINNLRRTQYRDDPVYNITQKLRARFRIALIKGGAKRKRRSMTRDLLGMSFECFRSYLESLWLPGMSWDNHGQYIAGGPHKWAIDHIKPCAAFDLTDPEQQRKCFHYTNMQPMWAVDNFSKNSRYNGVIIRKTYKPLDTPSA